jgi:hypothetical protein
MYSTRFNGHTKNKGDHDQMDTVPVRTDPHPPSSPLSNLVSQTISGAKRRRRRRELASINTLYYIHILKEVTIRLPLSKHTHTHTHTQNNNITGVCVY